VLGVNAYLNRFTDKTAIDAIGVFLDSNGTAGAHPYPFLLGIVQPAPRQAPEHLQFFPQTVLATAIQLLEELLQKTLIFCPAFKVPMASQSQGLL